MLMTDVEIHHAMDKGDLVIEGFYEPSLQPASYDMRIGKKILISGIEDEIDLEKKGSITIKAGNFALLTTYEKVKLSNTIAGHIGVKSYYTRKGLVLLAGLQIDPGFEGVLVLGVYNASPRSITIDYLAPFCTVEFHKLSIPVSKPFVSGDEQKMGLIPKADKDYLRTLETKTLSEMSEAVRQLSVNVGQLSRLTYTLLIPLIIGLYIAIFTAFYAAFFARLIH